MPSGDSRDICSFRVQTHRSMSSVIPEISIIPCSSSRRTPVRSGFIFHCSICILSFHRSFGLSSDDIFLACHIEDHYRQTGQNDVRADQIPAHLVLAEEIIDSKRHRPFLGRVEEIQRHDKLIPRVQEAQDARRDHR